MNRRSLMEKYQTGMPVGRSAFTLIELMLVMVILVVLAAVVVPKFANRLGAGPRGRCQDGHRQPGNARWTPLKSTMGVSRHRTRGWGRWWTRRPTPAVGKGLT